MFIPGKQNLEKVAINEIIQIINTNHLRNIFEYYPKVRSPNSLGAFHESTESLSDRVTEGQSHRGA